LPGLSVITAFLQAVQNPGKTGSLNLAENVALYQNDAFGLAGSELQIIEQSQGKSGITSCHNASFHPAIFPVYL